MDVDAQILAIWQLRPVVNSGGHAGTGGQVCGTLHILRSKFTLANVDTARKGSLIVVNAVVVDMQVMPPGVNEDGSASLGTVGDGQPIDARGVALEVAGEGISRVGVAGVAEGI